MGWNIFYSNAPKSDFSPKQLEWRETNIDIVNAKLKIKEKDSLKLQVGNTSTNCHIELYHESSTTDKNVVTMVTKLRKNDVETI